MHLLDKARKVRETEKDFKKKQNIHFTMVVIPPQWPLLTLSLFYALLLSLITEGTAGHNYYFIDRRLD
jgi:hypothetical protein